MPVTQSVKKALRVSLRRQKINLKVQRGLKRSLNTLREKGIEVWPKTQSAIDKSVKAKILSKHKAARLKSRLHKRLRVSL